MASSLMHIPGVDAVYDDESEWGPEPWRRGAPILRIEVRKWSDLLVISPLDANTLTKVVNGICSNLLTSVVRAWDTDGTIDGKKKSIVVAPPCILLCGIIRLPQNKSESSRGSGVSRMMRKEMAGLKC